MLKPSAIPCIYFTHFSAWLWEATEGKTSFDEGCRLGEEDCDLLQTIYRELGHLLKDARYRTGFQNLSTLRTMPCELWCTHHTSVVLRRTRWCCGRDTHWSTCKERVTRTASRCWRSHSWMDSEGFWRIPNVPGWNFLFILYKIIQVSISIKNKKMCIYIHYLLIHIVHHIDIVFTNIRICMMGGLTSGVGSSLSLYWGPGPQSWSYRANGQTCRQELS